jgi:pimeloyl-ACP methyl ester carboxylesterase
MRQVLAVGSAIVFRPYRRWQNAKRLIINSPNGIDESQYVKIGGIDHWMTIRGEDISNPVLLFLHGGPGATHTVFNALTRPWEQHFTIVQYDQRGSGRTLRRSGPPRPGELTLDRLEQDATEVAEYLRQHLAKDKLLLAASSVGTTFGTALAQHRPELFSAYLGTDQNTTPDAPALTYELTLAWLRQYGNRKGVRAVERIGPDYPTWTRQQFDDVIRWTIKANPTIPDMVLDVIFPAMMGSPLHSMRDIRDISTSIKLAMDHLYAQLVDFDARALGLDFAIPFFIFQGDTDAITPTAKAQEYFDEIRAPHKEFVLIRNSGHLAAFTRPEQFLRELIDKVRPFAVTSETDMQDATPSL